MLQRPALALVALAIIAVCTACSASTPKPGSSSPSSSSSTSKAAASGSTTASVSNPCTLATAADITAAFGGTSATGATDTDAGETKPTCKWHVTGSNLGNDGDVLIKDMGQNSTQFGYAKDGISSAVSISGVGDSAFYIPLTTSLSVLKGEKSVTVQSLFSFGGTAPDPAKVQADVVALATVVAGKF